MAPAGDKPQESSAPPPNHGAPAFTPLLSGTSFITIHNHSLLVACAAAAAAAAIIFAISPPRASYSSRTGRPAMIVGLDAGGRGGMELEEEWYRCSAVPVSSAAATELELCAGRIRELRAELELERRMRRKAEALNEVLAVELSEERRRSGAAEAECRRLREEVGDMRAEVERALEEIDEERRALHVAELWREERVQMKLADARAAMEERLREIAGAAIADGNKSSTSSPTTTGNSSPTNHQGQHSHTTGGQLHRREVAVAGGENPHITRGIKGFVEFPRAVRVRPREERVDLVSNLECQRAQLRVLTRHRNPPAGEGVGLAAGSDNLVV